MEIYVIRHAIAEDHSASKSDGERALTAEGRARFSDEVRGLATLGVRFDRVYHSPLVRAVQTAGLLTDLISDGGESIVTDLLAATPSTDLLDELEGDCVCLVGHEPWMSETVSLLLFGNMTSSLAFVFKKGGVAWLSGSPRPGGASMRAFYPPKSLRALGTS